MIHVVVAIISRKREDKQEEYLLVKSQKDFGEFTGCWYPPGGHMEEGETEIQTLVREIKEELNFDIKVGEKVGECLGDVKDYIISWYECELLNFDMNVNKEELADVGWFTKEEMGKDIRIWPKTFEFLQKYIENKVI
ncbi:MAG: NUDIX hydrolase [Burkholderiales bacterium]|nr:NUDIX hydrolase [Burkholderiales bacterium]